MATRTLVRTTDYAHNSIAPAITTRGTQPSHPGCTVPIAYNHKDRELSILTKTLCEVYVAALRVRRLPIVRAPALQLRDRTDSAFQKNVTWAWLAPYLKNGFFGASG
jgi:hypothetical protein